MKNFRLCFVVLILVSTLYVTASPIYVHAALTVTVNGRVLDEYEKGIKNVEIEVYAFDETYQVDVYVKSASTSSDGSFAIGLPVGKDYTLHFSKAGYTRATRKISIKVYGTGEANLGEVVLLKGLRLSSSIFSRIAGPGEKLKLPFTVSNIGEEPGTVEFTVAKPADWSTRILDQTTEVTGVYLSSGGTLHLELEATIPLTSAGNNSILLTAAGKTSSTLNFTINVVASSNPIISCDFPGQSAAPGESIRFQVRVKNPFGIEMRFKIIVDNIPPNWTASVRSPTGEYVTETTLDSNEFVDLVVEVKSPETARIGEQYGLVVKAESYDGGNTDSLLLNVALSVVGGDIKITTKFKEVTVQAGKAMQYPITIANLANIDRLLMLSVDAPSDWKVSFKSGALEVSTLYLEAGSSENLVVDATPPSTVDIGTYTIPVRVRSEDGAVYEEMELRATIVGSYNLRLELSTLLTSVTAGGSTSFTARVTNAGQTSLTGISLDIDVPADWEFSSSPIRVDLLEPRESYTFNVAVETTEDTVAGDYMITLAGLSDQVDSDQVQVRITVTTPTSWILYGVGVAVVCVVALVLVFMKFKRR
ncbi:MAG: NEW3 domain-containing protein [Candidatus Bathyarchaeia archaeon]